jgi:hypothetical protein
MDCGGGAFVYIEDIDDGSFDPDGDLADVCIVAVDGAPVGCLYSYYVEGVGVHDITIRATDDLGASDECTGSFTVQNEDPVAQCRLYAEHPWDMSECITVGVSDIDDGSYDPDGDPIDTWIVAMDGTPTGPTNTIDVCGVGEHTLTLRVEDCNGAWDECTAEVWVTNNEPWITCRPYTVHMNPDECVDIYVSDILDDYGDPDGSGDIYDICITAIDGTPMPCDDGVEVCGEGLHTVTLRITDVVGAYAECTADVELFNNAPVAECVGDYSEPAGPGGCIWVDVYDLDDGSFDPDGDFYDICIIDVDGSPVPCEYEVEICTGIHTLTLQVTDEFGATDECDVEVEVINTPPEALCVSYADRPTDGCCLTVSVLDIDGGSFDPDGDPTSLGIVEVDGVDVGNVEEYEICGEGPHDVVLRITDEYGAFDECMTEVYIENEPPSAYCRPYSDHGDEGCCITVHWTDIDDFSGDPDGPDNIARIGITSVDGDSRDWEESVEICDQGWHTIELGIEDECGRTDFCTTDIEITNEPPVAMCKYYGADADEDCCIMVSVDDVNDGSYDPDGTADIESILITEIEGFPVTPAEEVQVCGQGAHTVTLTITDYCGESDECFAEVEVLNQPPVAVCMDHIGYADEFCCITVGVDSIDGGSYDPDGEGDIASLCITEVDGMVVPCEEEIQICGVGLYPVTLEITDWCGETDECVAWVDLVDITPPEIEVELNRYVLWPPNHKMADIVATVEATDNCDPDPAVVLVSITSDEPDNDIGDGNTVDDIQGAAFMTEDYEFQLRSERQGGGDGRVYTIVYRATDFSGNSADDTVYVRVPHDQSGMAVATTGFTWDGTGIEEAARTFTLVIMSRTKVYGTGIEGQVMLVEKKFNAPAIDLTQAYVGNTMGVLLPVNAKAIDQDGDRKKDLALTYRVADLQPLLDDISDPLDPIGLHYQSENGVDYLVPDIFQMGLAELLGGGARTGVDDAEETILATRLFPVQPNPFSARTTIRFSLRSEEEVSINVYDARGGLVRTLVDQVIPSGQHQVVWDGKDNFGRNVATGVYFTRFKAGDYSAAEKTMYLR